jgi:hypothetical protein
MALKSLNSGKLIGIDNNRARGYVQESSAFSLRFAYPVLALVIENAVRNYKDTDQASTHLRPIFKATLMGADLARRLSSKMRNTSEAHRLNAENEEATDQSLIKGGQRAKALERIRNWVRNGSKGRILICDPYFSPENLDMVQLIRAENREIPIEILTSWKHQKDEGVQMPWDEIYQLQWRMNFSESDPGDVHIVVVGAKQTGALPIHDRWCISESTGLRLGSSLNSIGLVKASEVTEIDQKDFPGIKNLVEKYLTGVAKTDKGERLLSMSFDLG